jgi:AraC-like DNA-binding protein
VTVIVLDVEDTARLVRMRCPPLPKACWHMPIDLMSTDQRSRLGMRDRNSPSVSRDDRLPSTVGGMTRLAYARAKAACIALDPLLKQADLTHQEIEDPRSLLKVRNQVKFLNLVAVALEDDLLGFHLAQSADLRQLGMLYYLLASSETLIDALHRAARYSSLVNEGLALRCPDGKSVRISFHCVGISRHLDTHQIECSMTALLRICGHLTGLRLKPNRVRLMHHRSRKADLAKVFGDNIEFGATADDITFSDNVRQLPVVSADPFLNELMISYCDEAISRRQGTRGSFRSKVENVVATLLPHGKAHADEIARQLGLSQRTFARRLSEEGLSFSEVLDGLRSDLANRHLADRDLAVSQIAWLLGYRDVSAFSHAFKRWTGKTPGQARAEYAA